MKKAVILLSGGLDSTTCLAIAKSQGFDCFALSFHYGQRHNSELAAAKQIAKHFGVVEHRVVELDLTQFGGSALTDDKLSVPNYNASTEIPITYVPARNTIFLSIAMGFAEVIQSFDLFIGANEVDYSHYPDCRKAFIDAFQAMANVATKSAVEGHALRIHAPLLAMTKAQIIQTGLALGVDYRMTRSCYQLNEHGEACGHCDSCTFRKQGFLAANALDPTQYVTR